MAVRSKGYNIPPTLNTKTGRRLVSLIPDYFSTTPDSAITQLTRAIGGMVEKHKRQSIMETTAQYTNYFSLFGHPNVWYTDLPLDRYLNIVGTSHLEIRDEEDFLRTAAIGHMDSESAKLTPIELDIDTPSKLLFYVEYADKIYNRRLFILDSSDDLYKSTIASTPMRINSVGQLSTASTDPYFETISAYGTPALQIKGSTGSGTPADTTAETIESLWALHIGGFFEVQSEIVPNTVTVYDRTGTVVDATRYSVSANRLTPESGGSGNGDMTSTPLRIKYVPKRLAANTGVFADGVNSLRLLQSGTLTVTNVFRDDPISTGKEIKIEVVSPTVPRIESIKVVYDGTSYLGTHVAPTEATFTDIIAEINVGEVENTYVITLHAAASITAWTIDAPTPAPTTDFTVTDLSLAFSSAVKNDFTRDLYVVADNKLSIFEPFPLKRKEILLKAGQATFSGTTVSGEPTVATNLYLYLDGQIYEIVSSAIQDLNGNSVTIREKTYSYAYIALELDLETMYDLADYTFEDMASYQDTLIFLAREDADATNAQLVYVDMQTLKEVQSAIDPLDASSFTAFAQTYTFEHLKSITCTDYGTLLMMWNLNNTTAITEHFLEYDTCFYNDVTEQMNFHMISDADFGFTENGSAATIARSDLSTDVVRHSVDSKAAIYTALKDGQREAMRERPHFSSGYTLLDFFNSYLKKLTRHEDTTEQGLINVISRITRNTSYDLAPRMIQLPLPEFTSIDNVWITNPSTNTKYTISQKATAINTGSTSSTFTSSSFYSVLSKASLGTEHVVSVEFLEVTLNTAIANRESSVYEGILLEVVPGTQFRVAQSGLIAREIAGRIIIELTKPITLATLGSYLIGVQSDIEDNFSGTKYATAIGKTMNAFIPLNGLSSLPTDAPKATVVTMEQNNNYNVETIITGLDAVYHPYNYGIILNTAIPPDWELTIDYTQLIDGITISKRFFKNGNNNSMVARPSDYVEVAVV